MSGCERMPIYANSTANSATFNLIQVLPNAAGKSFTFSGFDFGDCTDCSGDRRTVEVPAARRSTTLRDRHL